jgi:amino-acid N-acetyltransferase
VKERAAATIRASRASDLSAVRRLLDDAQLPTADLASNPALRCWVLEVRNELIGVIGLECADVGALVRSLVVAEDHRGQGWGRELLMTLEREAGALGIRQLVLLTETAQQFFSAHDYAVIERGHVPEALLQTAEFHSLCPVSAVCMTKSLRSGHG